jgi:hypothetical protein
MGRRRQREAELRAHLAAQRTFQVYQDNLAKVNYFRYLGRILFFNNSDWPALYHNLRKAQTRWGMVARLLARDGASAKARGQFYVAITQAVLLYGCETWTVTPAMLKVLKSFHHKVDRRISGKMARLSATGWVYPPLFEAFDEAGLFPIQEYIRRRQDRLAVFVATRPIYARCQVAPGLSGSSSRLLRYWQQDHQEAMTAFSEWKAAKEAQEGGAEHSSEEEDDDEDDDPPEGEQVDAGIALLASLFGESDEEEDDDDDEPDEGAE